MGGGGGGGGGGGVGVGVKDLISLSRGCEIDFTQTSFVVPSKPWNRVVGF